MQVGDRLGTSDWHEVTQAQIDAFADATGDHQWIHVDRERAAAGPFGTTIAHGYLTLSLAPALLYPMLPRDGSGLTVNYGLNRVRFPAPVPAGSRVRGRFRIVDVSPVDGGLQATIAATVEREGEPKPVCVAELLLRFLR